MEIRTKNHNLELIKKLVNQALLEVEKGNFLEAQKIYLKIIYLNENYLLAYFNLLIINENLFDQKKFEKIKDILKNPNLNYYEKSVGNFIISFF